MLVCFRLRPPPLPFVVLSLPLAGAKVVAVCCCRPGGVIALVTDWSNTYRWQMNGVSYSGKNHS